MKNNILISVIIFFYGTCNPAALTYVLNGGRFGDNLSTYCKAKIFSYKYDIPLLYKPFEYSDQLILHNEEILYCQDLINQFDEIIQVKNEDDIRKNKNRNVLLVTNFYTPAPGLYEHGFTNPAHAQDIKRLLTPINLPPPIEKNQNEITIALHVRKGGGFDAPLASEQITPVQTQKKPQFADQQWPTKFPPDQFYIDQLRLIRKLTDPEKIMIIYLFTDDPDPAKLANRYKEHLKDINLEFRYRHNGNSHKTGVVEDFYLMSQCDCLIRSTSLLARASQLLGQHKIIIYPIQGYWVDNTLIINPVGIIVRK